MREMISQLLLQIDEAWLDHAQRIRNYKTVSTADIELEEVLFAAAEWLDSAERRSRKRAKAVVVRAMIVSTLALIPIQLLAC